MAIHIARPTYTGLVTLVAAIALGGCNSIGPRTVEADRIDYSTAITESWKQQTLLNIVKLRYADPPIFVDIGQIIAGYSLETSINAGAQNQDLDSALGGDIVSLGGAARFTDRPTITYVPLTGNTFVNNLITPIPPISLFSAIQAGWNADSILRLGVGAINGIANEQFSGAGYLPADPRFARLIDVMRELQVSGALTIRGERGEGGAPTTLFALTNKNRTAADEALGRELREMLALEPGRFEFDLRYGRNAASGAEIAVQSRSLLNILQIVSSRAVVPPEHVLEGRAAPGPNDTESLSLPGFRILSSQERPEAPYVAARYRDTWFYVDDTDLRSKRVFSLIMLLFTLADSSPDRAAPVITIPAQ